MPFNVTTRRYFKNKFKKLNKQLQIEVLNITDEITSNPFKGDKLKNNLSDFHSFHFHRSPEYRIMYRVYLCHKQDSKSNYFCELENKIEHNEIDIKDCNGLIDYIFLDTREEFNNLYKLTGKEIRDLGY